MKNKEKQLSRDEFLLWSYKNSVMDYKESLKYFEENKKEGLWSHYKRIIKENGAIILFGNGMFTAELMMSNKSMWKYNLIWEKTQPTGFQNANKMPMRNHEDMCVFYNKLPTYNPQKTGGHIRKVSKAIHQKGKRNSLNYNEINKNNYDSTERFPKSVWKFSKDTQKSSYHPTQKPIGLLKELIKTYSNEGDLILDSCMGSGSTGVASLELGRRFIGIEKDKEFYEIAKERIGSVLSY